MGKSLVIVESPAKARTINRFLGKKYQVKASMGHVRDLPKNPKKKGQPDWIGIDEEDDFKPHYIVLRDKKKTVDDILAAAKTAEEVLLAADPDREGEAICWHLEQILKKSNPDAAIHRVEFNEITKQAIENAIKQPREIDTKRVDAQQARRILDRIVGYRISPLLWDRVRRGLSAGRVQTVALRMVVDREREIEAFKATEYWTVEGTFKPEEGIEFKAKLHEWRGDAVPWKGKRAANETDDGEEGGAQEGKTEKIPTLANEAAAAEVLASCGDGPYRVKEIEAKRSRRSPAPPFTTSKLQQEAARRLSLPVARTMRVAQSLYEGKDLGDLGTVGLITYMRTDSTRVSPSAIDSVREYIGETFGKNYVPESPRSFKQKKSAQDAHEAIRPTSMDRTPEKLASVLNRDELRLYRLIWTRFVASQMERAEFDVTTVDISAGDAVFRASGQVMRFPGWMQAYQAQKDDKAEKQEGDSGEKNDSQSQDATLPALEKDQVLQADEVLPQQNFTQPPPRYTEAMLVRALEENGIGRPSTYAAIISVLSDRDYVARDEGRFHPSELGNLIVDLMVEHFGDIFEVGYTAQMEAELDQVEEGEKNGVAALREFSDRFRRSFEKAREAMPNIKQRQIKTDIKCDKCDGFMNKRWGRFGEFLACENYPDCKNTRDLDSNSDPLPEVSETCSRCGKEMTIRRGRWGPFLACTGYPDCKTTRKIEIKEGQVEIAQDVLLEETCPDCGKQLAKKTGRYGEYVACSGYPHCRYTKQNLIGVPCPKCGSEVAGRRSRRGRVFYGCSSYPKCDFVAWKKPIATPCPNCGAKYMLESITKKHGRRLLCDDKECGHAQDADEGSSSEAAS